MYPSIDQIIRRLSNEKKYKFKQSSESIVNSLKTKNVIMLNILVTFNRGEK